MPSKPKKAPKGSEKKKSATPEKKAPTVSEEKISDISENVPTVSEEKISPISEETATTDSEETEQDSRLLNAEQVTQIAADFLRSLGNKKVTPTRVSVEGEKFYVVEAGLKKKVATVLIDADAKEIKEYEINRKVKGPSFSSILSPTKRTILLICGINVLLYIALNLLKTYLPFPLPF